MVAVYPLHRFYSRKVGAIIGAEEMERCLGEELIGNIGADSECIATRTGNAQFLRIEAEPQFPFLVWRIHRFDFGIVRYADSYDVFLPATPPNIHFVKPMDNPADIVFTFMQG